MTKPKTMDQLTAIEITARLAEIDAEQRAFDARDFDAELGEAMRQGANVDALEEQHLQAERVARRLRVERQALESALPEAKRREGGVELASVEAEFDALTERATKVKAEILEGWQTVQESLTRWGEVQKEADDLARRVVRIGNDSGITSVPKQVGKFRSAAIGKACSSMGDALYRIDYASSSQGMGLKPVGLTLD
ncbi:hypothetical protein OCT51_11175 [Halomonas sp. LR3S48]|uniref:hypothetical protein n=1 Tax=Halomonas sp. LR3S48 TaxID=2982694 RepID=UPI0021E45866|nr:hypothetical protein [Halomonas sp. LR3S48]UYG01775.1 hypothetical protein OCT51_11175 [Halomonas sp. LR3S48]